MAWDGAVTVTPCAADSCWYMRLPDPVVFADRTITHSVGCARNRPGLSGGCLVVGTKCNRLAVI
jgi:hypothetical protein